MDTEQPKPVTPVDLDRCDYNAMSIDEVLRWLIKDSDLAGVVCCLDSIASEDGQFIELWGNNGERVYPHADFEQSIAKKRADNVDA